VLKEESHGWVQHGLPCDACGSSDARAINDKGWGKCFSCGKRTPPESDGEEPVDTAVSQEGREKRKGLLQGEDLVFQAFPRRGLTEETCRFFTYSAGYARHPKTREEEGCHVAPYYRDGSLVAQKLRFGDKSFTVLGDGKDLPLFGMNRWQRGPRIVITEGEVDCLSVAQATGLKMPVVSLPSGAQNAHKVIKGHLDYLLAFDQIVLWFDNDEHGRAAVEACVDLLPVGRVFVVRTPAGAKDANDLLVAKRTGDIVQAIFQAKPFKPDNLMAGAELKDRVKNMRKNVVSFPWGYEGLDRSTRGIRQGEVTLLTAGVGAGKSTLVREVQYAMARAGEPFAAFMLEDSPEEAALGLVSIHLDRRLHLDDGDFMETDEFSKAYDESAGLPNVYIYDNRGTLNVDDLETKIRHAVKHLGVRWVYLDNVTALMAGSATDDERKAIDNTMMKMRSLTLELHIGVIVVCHLRRPEGEKGYENGKEVTANALRGSGGLIAFSLTVVALERNQQDDEDKNHIRARVLKCRFTGFTGVAGHMEYDRETGRLHDAFGADAD
jgi:twinkle protein